MKKRLFLVRHGQTLFNVHHKIQGWCDSPLTELGIAQAQKAAKWFKEQGIEFDHAYSSTSERACDTLEIITNQPYTRLKELKERNFGAYEAQDEFLHAKPPLFEAYYDAFGGETCQQVKERMSRALREIMEKKDHSCVLAASHAGAILLALAGLLETEPGIRRLPNCAIVDISVEDSTFFLNRIIDPETKGELYAAV